ncbi:MAG TPA: hypothetical protein DEP84_08360 [Chloroflexi bacterium]|nr:hypothetical protein [Chloroflexota bacterium]
MHVLLEFRPAPRIEAFFENFFGFGKDGETEKQGLPILFQIALLFQGFNDKMRLPPLLFGRLLPMLAPGGRLPG